MKVSVLVILVATTSPTQGFLEYTRYAAPRVCQGARATLRALAAGASSSSGELLGGTKWRCEIDFGREKGTWMEPRYRGGAFLV
jgi:hypothetical protein